LSRRNTWEEVEQFAHHIADTLATHASDQYVANMRKALRQGRIYVDYLRNQRGATAVASYSTRNRPGCPVATNLDWKELARVTSADMFTIENVPTRLSRLKRDPWDGFFQSRQTLTRRTLERVAEFAVASNPTSSGDAAGEEQPRTKSKPRRRSRTRTSK
jgi:bifunctional non-homologous end joining protein LigD